MSKSQIKNQKSQITNQQLGIRDSATVASRKSLKNKDFTGNSLFLKDLAKFVSKSLIPKDRGEGGRGT